MKDRDTAKARRETADSKVEAIEPNEDRALDETELEDVAGGWGGRYRSRWDRYHRLPSGSGSGFGE